jgi:hypothetical protein
MSGQTRTPGALSSGRPYVEIAERVWTTPVWYLPQDARIDGLGKSLFGAGNCP